MLGEAGCSEFQIAAITGHSVVNSQLGGYSNMGRNLAVWAYGSLNDLHLQVSTNYLHISD